MPSAVVAAGEVVLVSAESPQSRFGRWWDGHDRLLRALAVVALLWQLAYLTWRIGWSWDGAQPVLWLLLLLVEGYAVAGLAALTVYSWRRTPPVRPPGGAGHGVDVHVRVDREPESTVRATLTGCRRLAYPHRTYLVDAAGRRPELAALAAEYGAEYVTAPPLDRHLVLLLDADQVPLPDAIDALVGYFDDPTVAAVQTPHAYLNSDSAGHFTGGRHDGSLDSHVVAPGRDRFDAAPWYGSAAMIRATALQRPAGQLRTRFHGEIVVQGTAPHDIGAMLDQRWRRTRRRLAAARSALVDPGMRATRRIAVVGDGVARLAGPVRVLTLTVLATALATGALPFSPDLVAVAVLWAPALVLRVVATAALYRGFRRLDEADHLELVTAETDLRALVGVRPRTGTGTDGRVRAVRLPAALGVALLAALVVHPLAGSPTWATGLVALVAAVELWRVARTVRRVTGRRQERAEFRFPTAAPIRVGSLSSVDQHGSSGELLDVNVVGVSFTLPRHARIGSVLRTVFELPDATGAAVRIAAHVAVTSVRAVPNGFRLGGRFIALTPAARHAIVEYCYVVSAVDRLRLTSGPGQLRANLRRPSRRP